MRFAFRYRLSYLNTCGLYQRNFPAIYPLFGIPRDLFRQDFVNPVPHILHIPIYKTQTHY